MTYERKKRFLLELMFLVACLLLAYVTLKYIIPLFLPFLLGFCIAWLLKPVVAFIMRVTQIKRRKIIGAVVVVVLYAALGLLCWTIIAALFSQIQQFFSALPSFYSQNIKPFLESWSRDLNQVLIEWFPEFSLSGVASVITALEDGLAGLIADLSQGAISYVVWLAPQLPGMLLTALVTIVSSIFITLDYENIARFVMRQFSDRSGKLLLAIKNSAVVLVFKLLKSYLLIMLITYCELFLGLLLLQIPYAAVIAGIIAIVDILPVLGSGTVLIPWGIILLAQGNLGLGAGILILYGVITAIRYFIEPKIIGEQVGLHPLVTLCCIYVGLELFGFIGLFLLPITATVIHELNKKGIIHLYKTGRESDAKKEVSP